MSRLAAPYVPRRPQETTLYALVREHLGDFLQYAREAYEGPLPRYVVNEYRRYLECGDFAHGFVHVQCRSCGPGAHDLAVAFSCKLRGLCPSCAGRRMAGSAAHLVDCIVPAVPLRQYVLAFPFELSGLAATRPDVLSALSRIFWESLRLRYRRWAKAAGYATAAATVETGAVTGVHRAGASLNVHVHFHVLCLDGVYVDKGGSLHFEAAPAPTREELEEMLERIYGRVIKWLSRRGLLRDTDASNAPPEPSPAEALTAAGMQRGTVVTTRAGSDLPAEPGREPPRRGTDAVVHEGFNLHASLHLAAHDDLGRERLCRYLTRPAFSVARLRMRRDGYVTYDVKKAGRGRVRQRVMTPVECLARLAAMVPPPRYPLLRLHGVLAPRHAWRAQVVPRPRVAAGRCKAKARDKKKDAPTRAREKEDGLAPALDPRPERAQGDGLAAFVAVEGVPTSALTASGAAEQLGPNILSVAHWKRIDDGELYAPMSRVEWALLLKRTFQTDVRVCPRCGGRLEIRAVVTAPASVFRLLSALRRPRDPPAAA